MLWVDSVQHVTCYQQYFLLKRWQMLGFGIGILGCGVAILKTFSSEFPMLQLIDLTTS